MAQIYYDADASLELLKGKLIGVLGFGSQGHAHALNLKDSGLNVLVGLREGSSKRLTVEKTGLKVASLEEVAQSANLIAFLIPDTEQPKVYQEKVAPYLSPGKILLFAHGFNIHYHQIIPPEFVDVVMVAPKAPGTIVRQLYLQNAGTPALLAIYRSPSGKAKEFALAYAKGIGCTKAGVLETTFAEETETDLFGEQVVLCGGITALIKAAFETLVEAGYQPELAYFECLHELKLIVDLIYQGGITHMRRSVSDTAKYGDLTRGPRIINEEVRQKMKEILKEIRSGTFAREWILENKANRPVFNALMKQDEQHLIEQTGKKLRAMMPWLKG